MLALELRPSKISAAANAITNGSPQILSNTFNSTPCDVHSTTADSFSIAFSTSQSASSGGSIVTPSVRSYAILGDDALEGSPSVEPNLSQSYDCEADRSDTFNITAASQFVMCEDR